MLKLSMYMFKNDMKCIFRGWWVFLLFPFVIFSLLVSPFMSDLDNYYLVYMTIVIISLLRPRFNKLYHVLPLNIEQIKGLFYLRTILLLLCLLLGTGCVIGVAEFFDLSWNRHGGLGILFYAQIFTCILHERCIGFTDKNRKNGWLTALAITGVIVSAFVMFGILELMHMPLIWQYVVQTLLLLTGVPRIIYMSKNMDFYDYEIPTDLYGNRLDIEK
ncbi:MAG: hypothetical protein IKL78_00435 [Lachnospiraceae bacterium]|nr:hypothetical protein [Lachnospiraceae bacterium]